MNKSTNSAVPPSCGGVVTFAHCVACMDAVISTSQVLVAAVTTDGTLNCFLLDAAATAAGAMPAASSLQRLHSGAAPPACVSLSADVWLHEGEGGRSPFHVVALLSQGQYRIELYVVRAALDNETSPLATFAHSVDLRDVMAEPPESLRVCVHSLTQRILFIAASHDEICMCDVTSCGLFGSSRSGPTEGVVRGRWSLTSLPFAQSSRAAALTVMRLPPALQGTGVPPGGPAADAAGQLGWLWFPVLLSDATVLVVNVSVLSSPDLPSPSTSARLMPPFVLHRRNGDKHGVEVSDGDVLFSPDGALLHSCSTSGGTGRWTAASFRVAGTSLIGSRQLTQGERRHTLVRLLPFPLAADASALIAGIGVHSGALQCCGDLNGASSDGSGHRAWKDVATFALPIADVVVPVSTSGSPLHAARLMSQRSAGRETPTPAPSIDSASSGCVLAVAIDRTVRVIVCPVAEAGGSSLK